MDECVTGRGSLGRSATRPHWSLLWGSLKELLEAQEPRGKTCYSRTFEHVTADCANHTVNWVNCVMMRQFCKNKELVLCVYIPFLHEEKGFAGGVLVEPPPTKCQSHFRKIFSLSFFCLKVARIKNHILSRNKLWWAVWLEVESKP